MSVKLTKEQILILHKYLDKRGLLQLDLRNEVLDHMANGIENSMQEDGKSFENTFKIEVLKWSEALRDHSNILIGLLYSGPKILIGKCVKIIRKIYLFMIMTTLLIALVLKELHEILLVTEQNLISSAVGWFYILTFVVFGTLTFLLRKSDFKTSHSFSFQAHFFGSCVYYIIYNPLFLDFMPVFSEKNYPWIMYLFHGLLISTAFSYCYLYHAHLKSLKRFKLV
jgi:hypothetical protein